MASITLSAHGPMVQWAVNRKRYSMRLSALDPKQAHYFAGHLDALEAAHKYAVPIPAAARAWLVALPVATRAKLAATGLIEPPADETPAAAPVTLKQFLCAHIERSRGAVKESTRIAQKQTIDLLIQHAGERLVRDLRQTEAADFRAFLLREGYAEATVRRHGGRARQFLARAIKEGLIPAGQNPFVDSAVPVSDLPNKANHARILPEDAHAVMRALPDAQWRLLFALARWGGLRVPSEPRALRWSKHVDFKNNRLLIHVPKKEHLPGHETRAIPLFPELRAALDAWRAECPHDEDRVIPMALPWLGNYAGMSARRPLLAAIAKAGVKPWPKLWQNLRVTRVNELRAIYPPHVVNAWMGHTDAIAQAHYTEVYDEDFQKAIGATGGKKALKLAQAG